jgi:hypothetical protein
MITTGESVNAGALYGGINDFSNTWDASNHLSIVVVFEY